MAETKEQKKKWWNNDLKYSLIYLAMGLVMGGVSYIIDVHMKASILMIVVFIGASIAINMTQKLGETKGWWFSKFIVYIFMWFLMWSVMHTAHSIYNVI